MPDAGPGAARRRARPSVRCRDGERVSRAERPGDPVPVEGEPEADPDRAPPRTRVPPGEPPGRRSAAARCRRQVARANSESFPQIMQHMVNDPGMGTLVVASAGADTQATEPPSDWWTPLVSSDGSGKGSNGSGTASL